MSNDNYNPNSHDAVLSRIETKLDSALKVQDEQGKSINKLWSALSRMDVRVTAIAMAGCGSYEIVKHLFF